MAHASKDFYTNAAFWDAAWDGEVDSIASDTVTDIGEATGNYVSITGTTTITSFDNHKVGAWRAVRFTGILTLTDNGTNIILPNGGSNITTAAGDTALFVQTSGAPQWQCIAYQREDGTSLVSGASDGYIGDVASHTAGGNLDMSGNSIQFNDLTGIRDANSALILTFDTVTSAINYLQLANAAIGTNVLMSAVGSDTDIGIEIRPKGAGNVLMGKFLFDGDQAIGAGQDNYVLTYDNGTGLISLEAVPAGGSSTFEDNVFEVVDEGDNTKKVVFSLGGATTNRVLTLLSAHTGSITLTFPNATDTLVGKATTDTLTNKTFDTNGSGNVFTVGKELDLGANSIGSTLQTATGDGTTTIDWGNGNLFAFQFGAFNETFTFTAPTKPGIFTLKLVQDSVGSRTVTWPATVKWMRGGTAMTLTTTATTGTDIISFMWDGTNYWAVGSPDFS